MKRRLLPLADLVTPNIPEAEILSGMEIRNKEDMEAAAEKISEFLRLCRAFKRRPQH